MQPFLTVIVPCRNEGISIRRCLESILASDYPPDRMEVLVADGMSGDDTRRVLGEVASEDTRIRVLENHARITPCGLNLAVSEARGDLIARVDAHSVIAPDYLSTLVRYLMERPGAWGAGGRMDTQPEVQGPWSEAIRIVLTHRLGVGNSKFRTAAGADSPQQADTVFNCCWRRDVFVRVGLFHEKLARSQDMEFSYRIQQAGGTLFWIPEARTTYFARVGFGAYLRHNWANGVWAIVPAIYLGHFPMRLRHFVPLGFVAGIVASLAAAAVHPALRWLPALPLIPYAALISALSAHLAARDRNVKLLVRLPLAFAGLHLAYGAGSCWGAVRLAHSWLQPSSHKGPQITQETL